MASDKFSMFAQTCLDGKTAFTGTTPKPDTIADWALGVAFPISSIIFWLPMLYFVKVQTTKYIKHAQINAEILVHLQSKRMYEDHYEHVRKHVERINVSAVRRTLLAGSVAIIIALDLEVSVHLLADILSSCELHIYRQSKKESNHGVGINSHALSTGLIELLFALSLRFLQVGIAHFKVGETIGIFPDEEERTIETTLEASSPEARNENMNPGYEPPPVVSARNSSAGNNAS